MITLSILLVMPFAQAQAVSHVEALRFINKQVANIAGLYSAGSIKDEEASLRAELSKNAFSSIMLSEYGLKYINNQDQAWLKYNEDKIVKAVQGAFSHLENKEINIMALNAEIENITKSTEQATN